MASASVVFPHPDSPTRPKISPSAISSDTSVTADTSAGPLRKSTSRRDRSAGAGGHRVTPRGSRRSRRPSPIRLNASTVIAIASPGKISTQGACVSTSRPSASISAERRRGRLCAESQERQRRLDREREPHQDARLDHGGPDRVRQHVADDDRVAATLRGRARLRRTVCDVTTSVELADDPREDRHVDHGDRDQRDRRARPDDRDQGDREQQGRQREQHVDRPHDHRVHPPSAVAREQSERHADDERQERRTRRRPTARRGTRRSRARARRAQVHPSRTGARGSGPAGPGWIRWRRGRGERAAARRSRRGSGRP